MTGLPPPDADFIAPTTDLWQEILPPDHPAGKAAPPYRFRYPARLPDGSILELPLRRLPDGERAVASLIANQASLAVAAALADHMAALAAGLGGDLVVGMPTLGLAFAAPVAERLGHPNYLPLGYSRKFWYRDELSEPVHSITSPDRAKRVFVDPNLLPRLAGRRLIVVDDAVSSGTTLVAVLALLGRLDCSLAGIVVAMRQGIAWRERLAAIDPGLPDLVRGAFAAPIFARAEGGWVPIPGTLDPGLGG
ncbi:phosphoribosyltransferase [Marinibaculum pumilum]|uniref:Phosphoribosyltransferase n=1 Tax=Marinibaculum pumilum TaxID=1766165 RepID=A0ABV7KVW0_9PROT